MEKANNVMSSTATIVNRYVRFLIGMALTALGPAIVIKTELGTVPISTLPYVASLGFSPSIGIFTIAMNLVFVAVQAVILRDKFSRAQFMQIFVGFLFGFILDFWMAVVPVPEMLSYVFKILLLFTGIFIMALGIVVQVHAAVLMTAGEGIVVVLALALKRDFGTIKIAVDVTLVALGVLLSLLLFQEIKGVREGTLLSACFTGIFVKGIHKLQARMAK